MEPNLLQIILVFTGLIVMILALKPMTRILQRWARRTGRDRVSRLCQGLDQPLRQGLDQPGQTHRRHRHNIKASHRALKHVKELQASHGPHAAFAYLRALDPYVFEELVLSAFQTQGYRIQRNASYSGDGGVDGRVYDSGGNLMLIQSKRYRDAINPQHVKAFASVVSHQGASGGFFIHTGRTGPTRWGHASGQVTILSGQRLIELLTATQCHAEASTSRQ